MEKFCVCACLPDAGDGLGINVLLPANAHLYLEWEIS